MKPEPKTILICGTCDRPWTEHLTTARRRLLDNEPGYQPGEPAIFDAVNHLDCIAALKNANRGPIGYTGPMGATGAMGPMGPA